MKGYRTLGVMVAALLLLATASPAAAESRLEKNLELQPGGQFVLESEAGSVTVTGASRSGAHVVITSDREDLNSELDFSFSSSGGVAHVTARRKHESGWSHSLSVHFEIELPTETRTEIRTGGGGITLSGLRGAADVKTSGGPIEVTGLNGNLEAHTSGGPIHLREVTGDAHVATSGGPIDVDALDGNLEAHTSGGGIRIDKVSGYVEAKSSGGPIRATYSPGNRHGGVLETSGGSIEVAIDPSANLNLDASTSGGSVHSDLPVRVVGTITHSSMHGSIGSGGEELRLHTSGGSIHIRAL
ncbi:MAG TPA: DUF4097 family beta strand repeat-containing protein [Terriglobia bacterium]|nr:DUF4097 family beta strand repeat-containing protein [Terriglobia bacterium]